MIATLQYRFSLTQKILLGLGVLITLLAISLWSAPSAAAYSEIPDRTMMFPSSSYNGHSASDVYMVVANQGGGILLDAPESTVTFYFDTPNATISLGNGSGNCTEDSPQPTYQTWYAVVDGQDGSGKALFSSGSLGGNCGVHNINITNLQPYTIPGTSSTKYVAIFRAVLTDGGAGNLNSFRLSTNDGIISYSRNSGNKFALEDRVWQSATATTPTTRFDLPFAPSCNVTGTVQVNLSWFDDDVGTTYQGPLSMSLVEYTASGAPTGRVDNYPGPWGGEGVSRNWSVSVTQGRKYIWRWTGVSERNGIQFQLPFDSFYYDFRCDQSTPDDPPDPRLGVNCSVITYRLDDRDGDHYNIRIIIRRNATEPWQDTDYYASNQEPNVSHTFDFSDYRDFGDWEVSYRYRSYGTGNYTQDNNGYPPTRSTQPSGPCAAASCVGGPTPLTSPTPGETVRVRQNITTNIGLKARGTFYSASLASTSGPSSPSITPVDAGPQPGTWSNVGGSIFSGIGYPESPTWGGPSEYMEWDVVWPDAGEYNMEVTVTGLGAVLRCNTTTDGSVIQVTDKPYLRVWGGDVIVGCRNSAAWNTNGSTQGRILAFSRGNGRGAGSNLVVQAFDSIDQFSSAQRAGMTIDDYLTMANGGNSVGPVWGGNFGAGQCADDYFSSAPASSGSFSFPSASGTYSYSGNATIGARTIPDGRNITIFVDGDVTINGNITYPGSGSWSSLSQIPSLTIIARNIRITSGVSEVSGRFIAQPNGASGGVIQTCAPPSGSYTQAQLINNCRNQLTVYGSFVAKSVKFTRLFGSINTAGAGDSGLSNTAAERFIYGPELWLKSTGGSTTGAGSYDAIVAQPPVF